MDDSRSSNQILFASKAPKLWKAANDALCLAAIAGGLLMSPSVQAASFKVLCAFPTNSNPSSTLVQDSDGAYYGTTLTGGDYGYGSVYRVTADGDFTNLFSFGYTNGAFPCAPLRFGPDDILYGTTRSGESVGWYGTVFKMTTNGALTTLVSFAGTNGATPFALTLGRDGFFYGTTACGGTYTNRSFYGDGTVFRVTTNGLLTSLASFNGTNGWAPQAWLVQGHDGDFYGTTPYGGAGTNQDTDGCGTIFRVTTNGVLTSLLSFAFTNGAYPFAPLVAGQDGMLYGTACSSGTNSGGTVFRVTTNGVLTTLVSFDIDGPLYPLGGLVEGDDGAFYGTTTQGSFSSNRWGGTVFRVTTNGLLSPIYSFAELDGRWPDAAMIQGRDGAFYGTCIYGGSPQNGGTLFRLDMSTQVFPLKRIPAGFEVTFSGLPASMFSVLRASNLVGPWDTLSTVIAETNGIGMCLDLDPLAERAFYRIKIP